MTDLPVRSEDTTWGQEYGWVDKWIGGQKLSTVQDDEFGGKLEALLGLGDEEGDESAAPTQVLK